MHKKKDYKIILLLFALFILLLFLNHQNPLLLWDENSYLANARSHISESRYTEDYRFPLLEYIIAIAWKITGESIFIARLTIILFTLATVYLFYLICKQHVKNSCTKVQGVLEHTRNFRANSEISQCLSKYSLLITLFFSLNPLLLRWGFRIYNDIPSIFFILLAYYLLLKKSIFLAGIFSALAFLARFPLALFPLAAGIYFLYNKKPKHLLIFSAGFAIALFPWLLYNQLTYSSPIWDIQNQYNVIASNTIKEPLSKHFTNIKNTLGIFTILFAAGLFYPLKHKKHFIISLYILLSAIYYSAFVNLKLARYILVILPFVYLIAFNGFNSLTSSIKNKKIIFLLLAIIALFTASMFFNGMGNMLHDGNCGKQGAIMQSIEYMSEKNLTYQIIITNIFPYIGYHNNLESYHLWSTNIQALLIRYHPEYFIHSNYDGTYFNRTILDNNRYLRLEERFKGECGDEVSVYKVV
tara:strand:- start:8909 stop:10315 length:1407 start_codon:yes stop_codon:yes gene_type:complete